MWRGVCDPARPLAVEAVAARLIWRCNPEVTPERTKEFLPAIPIRRQPTPEELAWACVFLCSTRSAAITGVVIHVNGGEWMCG